MANTNPLNSRKAERKAQNATNDSLADLSRRYHDGIPVGEIADILTENGFDREPMDGIYCGREGRVHEQVDRRHGSQCHGSRWSNQGATRSRLTSAKTLS